MKKLNRKGFTLIELLAIIVILAIIMVVTIPTVLSSLSNARQEAFESAVKAVEKYAQDQYDMCLLGDATLTGEFNTAVITKTGTTCALATNANTSVIAAAGYTTTDIASVTLTLNNGKVKVTAATAGSSGDFNGATYSAS